ncbi:MAG: hypothetical protein HGA38_00070 [Candidatus Moranbacteria bacterium]|nr:hypothetical protein [Candidatus Moranbacteria bacterium]NTW45937.1 hypothetical protein [Candidatus Moranbacteria bacterium]
MKKVSRPHRFLLFACVAVTALAPVASAPSAVALSIPSPSKVASQLEQRYHIDQSSLQNLGEDFNVSDNKKFAPEVSVVFSPTDPRDGQKITAKAFPIYFSNPNDQLYYTWFLKRKGCDLGSASGKPSYCNADGTGGITVNDWKVAAARIIANDGADKAAFSYGSDSDDDGYDAEFGGKAEINTTNDWCYIHDSSSGDFYELASSESTDQFECATDGFIPACVSADQNVASDLSSVYEYNVSGNPSCISNTPSCPTGTLARCVDPDYVNTTFDIVHTEDNLTCTSGVSDGQQCVHLFARPSGTGQQTGDGRFGTREEFFWGTNPNDPDTADNGNKDESNVVGLGMDTFSWNYQTGDLVGIVVEGNSMISTKHDDSSMMITWAFSGDGCSIPSNLKSSYNASIKGYSVNIPTVNMSADDLDECLERDLVDPLVGGQGRSKKLEVDLMTTPDNPANDQTVEQAGDVVNATASISNSDRPESEVLYQWKVEIGDDSVDWNAQSSRTITGMLLESGLLPSTCRLSDDGATCSGNGLNSVPIQLNMGSGILGGLSDVNPIYMRVSVTASENFGGVVARTGKSDAIVRIANTDKKILPYVSGTVSNGASYKVSLGDSNGSDSNPLTPICSVYHSNPTTVAEASDNLDRVMCRVVKDEIIGLRVDNTGNELRDFRWTIDGSPLACDSSVSDDADCINGNEVFFAVVGDPGTTISAKLDAVDVETGRSVSLTRAFNVIQPEIVFEPVDQSVTWPRYVGQYTDLNGGTFDKYSSVFFEKFSDSPIRLRARFVPSFVEPLSTRNWAINGVSYDGETVWTTEEGDYFGVDYDPGTYPAGTVFNVSLVADIVQSDAKRIALRDLWGIKELSSAAQTVSQSAQVANVAYQEAALSGTKRFFAALSGYVSPVLSFAIRAILSGGLLLFAVGFAFSLVPESPSTDRNRGA